MRAMVLLVGALVMLVYTGTALFYLSFTVPLAVTAPSYYSIPRDMCGYMDAC